MADLGQQAHAAAVAHLEACDTWESFGGACDDCDVDECPGAPENEPDTAGPYCGCQDCVVREVLHAAWPFLVEAARLEVLAQLRVQAEAVPGD